MDVNGLPDESGIYAIVNTRTGERYVGQASRIRSRMQTHTRELNAGTHFAHLKRRPLQDAWNQHGADAFECTVLELVYDNSAETSYHERPDNLSLAEQYYIDERSEYNPDKAIVHARHRHLIEAKAWRGDRPADALANLKRQITKLSSEDHEALKRWLADA